MVPWARRLSLLTPHTESPTDQAPQPTLTLTPSLPGQAPQPTFPLTHSHGPGAEPNLPLTLSSIDQAPQSTLLLILSPPDYAPQHTFWRFRYSIRGLENIGNPVCHNWHRNGENGKTFEPKNWSFWIIFGVLWGFWRGLKKYR